jgi:anthranilate phosphoribosyltransferase
LQLGVCAYSFAVLRLLTEQLDGGGSLTDEQVAGAVEQLIDEQISAGIKAEFLLGLARKGETVEEIAAFARALRAKVIEPPLDAATRAREILDVCGTGGDHLNTFNISTTVALVVASAGVMVAKHGNRAITSQSGSADVLEALGIRIDLTPEEAAGSLRERGFAFFFAPKYHPAFKHIAPARKLCAERGQRTIFNFLGPLLNPARPTAQLIGVPRPQLCEPMARVLQSLGVRRGMVVCGTVQSRQGLDTQHATRNTSLHLDELSTLGENSVAEFYQERGFSLSTLSPENFPLQPATLADLAGGDRLANAEIIRRLLRGEERGPKRDAVLLNAAAALLVAGKSKSLTAGWELAGELIDGGTAAAKLKELANS